MPNGYLDKSGVAYLRNIINGLKTDKMSYQMRTAAEWDADRFLVSDKGVLYVYTESGQTQSGQSITGLKIGDGTSYLVDLPFVSGGSANPSQEMIDHMNNLVIHITQAERDSWNNKVTAYISNVQNETIIFSKE